MSEPKMASVDQLLSKPARTKLLEITLGEDKVAVKMRAISSTVYDAMLAANPPTKEQKKEGSTYNLETFAPALLAACMVDPELTLEVATEIWTSDQWSRGEKLDLFFAAVEINNKGLDIPTNAPA